MNRLNVGCGDDIKKGWVNLDFHNKNGADVIFDLNNIFLGKKLPFKDNFFGYVYCSHVLEDFSEPIKIMDELFRVCKIGGRVEIRVPFETRTWLNIDHKRGFSLFSFLDYFDRKTGNKVSYGDKIIPMKIEAMEYYNYDKKCNLFLYFMKNFGVWFYNTLGFKIVEQTFIKFLFPIINIRVIFKKE